MQAKRFCNAVKSINGCAHVFAQNATYRALIAASHFAHVFLRNFSFRVIKHHELGEVFRKDCSAVFLHFMSMLQNKRQMCLDAQGGYAYRVSHDRFTLICPRRT